VAVGVMLSWVLALSASPFAVALALGGRPGKSGLSLRAVLLLFGLLGISFAGFTVGHLVPDDPLVWAAQATVALGNVGLFGYALLKYGRGADGSDGD
jgi:hypothetical protein